jgi:hypothetical protein
MSSALTPIHGACQPHCADAWQLQFGELAGAQLCQVGQRTSGCTRGEAFLTDHTRLTQWGTWQGTVTVDGDALQIDPSEVSGTRDRLGGDSAACGWPSESRSSGNVSSSSHATACGAGVDQGTSIPESVDRVLWIDAAVSAADLRRTHFPGLRHQGRAGRAGCWRPSARLRLSRQ